MRTVRESRITAAYTALRKSGLHAFMVDSMIEKAAIAVVDALFPDRSMDHFTVSNNDRETT